uniref:Uncharacterized protein n=1 Tax=Oryza rufipogon TaxID=4529 RepID=A0A0E0NTQ8_ORYRU
MWARGTKPRKRRRKQKSANGGGKMLSNGAIRVDSLLRIRGSSRGRVPGRERPSDPVWEMLEHCSFVHKIGMHNVPEGTGCFARQDGVNTHTAWHVFLVNKSFTKHNYIGEGNLIPATEKVSFTPAKHRCVAVTGMATRVEMWALCASASGFSSEVWAVLDLKIVLAWLLVSETQNIRDFFTKGDTLVLHQLAVHLSRRMVWCRATVSGRTGKGAMSPSVCPTRRAGPVAGQPLPGRTPDAEVGQPQQQPALLRA